VLCSSAFSRPGHLAKAWRMLTEILP